FDLHVPHGFLSRRSHAGEIDRYVRRAHERGFFVERRFAEEDRSFQQLIPYVVVRRGADVLLLKRSKRGGDARLHDKRSIGVGGHVNPPDAEHDDLLDACARREIEEELNVEGDWSLRPIGVINDDSNPVGAVHFGIVYEARLAPEGDVRVRETELLDAGWTTVGRLAELAADPTANVETWSALIVPHLGEDAPE